MVMANFFLFLLVLGFMAERFVSVPVTVSVRFPCPVFLHYISIDNTLGSFTSTGIQVKYVLDRYKECRERFQGYPRTV